MHVDERWNLMLTRDGASCLQEMGLDVDNRLGLMLTTDWA